MKCEQFLPWLASESVVRVALARRHARRCESCRAAARMLDSVKRELSESGALPAHLRDALFTVGETTPVELPARVERRSSRPAVWLAAIAASVLVAMAVWQFLIRQRPDVLQQAQQEPVVQPGEQLLPGAVAGDARHVGPITIVSIDPSGELAQLEIDLSATMAQLQVVIADATRMAVMQELNRVIVDHERLVASSVSR